MESSKKQRIGDLGIVRLPTCSVLTEGVTFSQSEQDHRLGELVDTLGNYVVNLYLVLQVTACVKTR